MYMLIYINIYIYIAGAARPQKLSPIPMFYVESPPPSQKKIAREE